MPHSERSKGHVNFDTIVLYFVEFSLIKSIWERSICMPFSLSLSVRAGKAMFETKEILLLCGNNLHKIIPFNFLQVAFFVGVY